jgi:hypothetical protein
MLKFHIPIQPPNNFKEGISGVQLKNKWGFINVEGDVVIPFK